MQSLFYINKFSEIADFENFEVKPIIDSHSQPMEAGRVPKFWSVIGTLKGDKAEDAPLKKFPVADFDMESNAELFSKLCLNAVRNNQ